MGRTHRGDADRAQRLGRDRLQLPRRADHGRRSDARLRDLRQARGTVVQSFVVPLAAPEAADASRFGPKAANLARLGHAGLPTPGGFAIDAAAYRAQLKALDLEAVARAVFAEQDSALARRHALQMKLGLMDAPIRPCVLEPLLEAWKTVGKPCAVRSSALVEDRYGS